MFHLCMFGSYEGRLTVKKRVVFTAFGASELHRPTLARRLLSECARGQEAKAERRRPVVITLFGASEIKAPTLAEEFLDLREAMRSGALTHDALDRLLADLAAEDEGAVFSLTLFGTCSEAELPDENEEVDGLALQRHLGNISENEVQVLQYGVGQDDAQRRAVLRQAMAAGA
ncbi:MAG TPA: hypothetical protein VM243_19690 [Phycisphaerae bacterium]|nr:hypothetical protein [Phycisphaerae bacterium]